MFNRRLLQATSGGDIPIPENVTRLGLYWYPRSTMNATYSRLFRQVVAVAAGQQYRVDYFNWAGLASNARGTFLFMFLCNVLYCGYNSEIEKLPITASIA